MSRVLVEKETIYTEEVRMLMDGATYKEVIEEMDKREGQHEKNPFARVTPVSQEHVVSETQENEPVKADETPCVEENQDNNDAENN